jgi:hypothetical protein
MAIYYKNFNYHQRVDLQKKITWITIKRTYNFCYFLSVQTRPIDAFELSEFIKSEGHLTDVLQFFVLLEKICDAISFRRNYAANA